MSNTASDTAVEEPVDTDSLPRLEFALELLHRSLPLTLCPPNRKSPLGKDWTHTSVGHAWQKKRWTTEREIRSAFSQWGNLNVGLMMGPESGVIDIEVDDELTDDGVLLELFDGDLPVTTMFKSPRGPHRLFAWDDRLNKIGKATAYYPYDGGLDIQLGAGGKGAQSLLPPSITLCKRTERLVTRTWQPTLELFDCNPQPIPDVVVRKLIEANKRKRLPLNTGAQSSLLGSCVKWPDTAIPLADRLRMALDMTLPLVKGTRYKRQFKFTRCLKAMPEFATFDVEAMKPYIQQWFAEGHNAGVIGSGWVEVWSQFEDEWPTVTTPMGTGRMAAIYAIAEGSPLPEEARRYADLPELQRLAAICKALQDHAEPGQPFYLGCRDAGSAIGVSHVTASRLLRKLVREKILLLVKAGNQYGESSEYRYVGHMSQ